MRVKNICLCFLLIRILLILTLFDDFNKVDGINFKIFYFFLTKFTIFACLKLCLHDLLLEFYFIGNYTLYWKIDITQP